MERTILSPRNQELSYGGATRLQKTILVNGIPNSVVESIPTHITHQTPLLYIPGWGMEATGHASLTENLAQRGYTSFIAVGLSKRRGFKEGFSNIHTERAKILREVLNHESIPEINIVAHSEGAIIGALAAYQSLASGPRVKNLVLVSPAGLTGKMSGLQLASRFIRHGLDCARRDSNLLSSENKRVVRAGIRRTLRHPLIVLSEIHAIAQTSTEAILQIIRKNGIRIAIIQGDDDPVFPLTAIENSAEKAGIHNVYVAPHARHGDVYRNPHFADYIDYVLSDLDQKYQQRPL